MQTPESHPEKCLLFLGILDDSEVVYRESYTIVSIPFLDGYLLQDHAKSSEDLFPKIPEQFWTVTPASQ